MGKVESLWLIDKCMKWRGFLTCHCERSVRSNPLNISEEIASEKTPRNDKQGNPSPVDDMFGFIIWIL
ncbi:MAG: hypothetical protein JETT_1000 [Candidatus Jettenia ecosi]|uniref:Uncharacterized protein n=1 Tax=Candidatus Jettenia ecosi TaxID=2494326 RepID=A0A533QD28_9BACT|nr:MAG: hypothetical protein JETT_1000 [Candidatus Jettenia ecosi]